MAFVLSLPVVCCRWGQRANTYMAQKTNASVFRPTTMSQRNPIKEFRHPKCTSATLQTMPPVIWLPDEQNTYRLGQILGGVARAGDTLLLDGDLGAGKTCLARGYIHSARKDTSLQVTSPTYLLVNTFPQSSHSAATNSRDPTPTIYHLDLWRLQDASSRPIVDFEHLFNHAIALIEWPDRLDSQTIPEDRLEVTLQYPGTSLTDPDSAKRSGADAVDDVWGFEAVTNQGRTATLRPHGPKWVERVKSLCETQFQQNSLRDTVQYTLTNHPSSG